MPVLAPPPPAMTVLDEQADPPPSARSEPPTEPRAGAKSVVAWSALDVAREASRKLARRGFDWS